MFERSVRLTRISIISHVSIELRHRLTRISIISHVSIEGFLLFLSRHTKINTRIQTHNENSDINQQVLSVQLTSGGDEKIRLHSDDDETSSSDDDEDDSSIPKPTTPGPPTPIKIKVSGPMTTRPTIKGRHAILVRGVRARSARISIVSHLSCLFIVFQLCECHSQENHLKIKTRSMRTRL